MSRMQEEIYEVPDVLGRVLDGGSPAAAEAARLISRTEPKWIALLGRGTSGHAGLYARYLIEAYLGIPVALVAPSITTLYSRPISSGEGLLLAISQSGQSPDLLAVLEGARASGIPSIAITNDTGSLLARGSDLVIDLQAGPELSVAATKTYVASLASIAAIIGHLRPDQLSTTRLPLLASLAIESAERWIVESDVVESFSSSADALVLGRGFNLATSLEVALKLIETTGRFTIGYSTADFEHGPLALVRDGIPVLLFESPTRHYRHSLATKLARLGADVWSVRSDPLSEGSAGTYLNLRADVADALSPIPFAIPGQLLAEAVATRLGLDPDAPRGLSKVTLTL